MTLHRLCWFTTWRHSDGRFEPLDGGCDEEADQTFAVMRAALSQQFSINLDAFVPVEPELATFDPARLVPPERCLTVLRTDLVSQLTDPIVVQDPVGMPRSITADEMGSWLSRYRQRWQAGYHLVRTSR